MKERFLKNKKVIIILVITLVLLSFVGLCSWGIPVLLENSNNETNIPEDGIDNEIEAVTDEDEYNNLYDQENGIMDFIKVTYNDSNGKDYNFTLDDEDISFTKIGTQFSTKDYVYTYGYFWTENDAKIVPKDNSLEGWTKQEGDIGWGVAVKDRSKTTYENVYDTIAGKPVTWMNATYYNCVNMTSIPLLPSNVKHTDYMFYNCISLKSAILPSGMTTLGTSMFYKCMSLKYIYLPATITYIAHTQNDKYIASLESNKVSEQCETVNEITLPVTCTFDSGYVANLSSLDGVLIRQNTSYYYIMADTSAYLVKGAVQGYDGLRICGNDGNGQWVFFYDENNKKWNLITDLPTTSDNYIVPEGNNENNYLKISEIVYSSIDIYDDTNRNVISYTANTTSFPTKIYYGYTVLGYGAFKDCNSNLKIYCEQEEKPDGLSDALKGESVEYNINYVKMLEIKHDVYEDS